MHVNLLPPELNLCPGKALLAAFFMLTFIQSRPVMTTVCAQPIRQFVEDAIVSAANGKIMTSGLDTCCDNDTDASVFLALVGSSVFTSGEADIHSSAHCQKDAGKSTMMCQLQCSHVQLHIRSVASTIGLLLVLAYLIQICCSR